MSWKRARHKKRNGSPRCPNTFELGAETYQKRWNPERPKNQNPNYSDSPPKYVPSGIQPQKKKEMKKQKDKREKTEKTEKEKDAQKEANDL